MSLAAKLSAVMGEVRWVEKKGFNSFQNYAFVREVDIVDAVAKHLAERKVAILPRVVHLDLIPTTTQKGVAGFMATVTMSYTFRDGESDEELTVEAVGSGTDQPGDKAVYKAMTGAKKYALTQTFLIATGDDPEDEQAPKKTKAQPKPEPRQTPPSSPQSTTYRGPVTDVPEGRELPPDAFKNWQAPEEESQATSTPVGDAAAKIRRITMIQKIKREHPNDTRVVTNEITKMNVAEIAAAWPEIAEATP